MKSFDERKKTVLSYIYIIVLFLVVFIKKGNVKENIIFAAAMLCFGLAFLYKISDIIRIIMIIFISALGIASSMDYLFYILPTVFLFFLLKNHSDEKKYEKICNAVIILACFIAELIILFRIINAENIERGHEEIYMIFMPFSVFLELAFIVSLVLFIKNANIKYYVKQVNKIKNQKHISESKRKTISEYNEIKFRIALCLFNIGYVFNMLVYFSMTIRNRFICTFSALLWIIYLVLFYLIKIKQSKILKW